MSQRQQNLGVFHITFLYQYPIHGFKGVDDKMGIYLSLQCFDFSLRAKDFFFVHFIYEMVVFLNQTVVVLVQLIYIGVCVVSGVGLKVASGDGHGFFHIL